MKVRAEADAIPSTSEDTTVTDTNTPCRDANQDRGSLKPSPPETAHLAYNLLGVAHNTATEGRREKRRPKHEAMSSQDRTAPPAQAWGHASKEVRPAAGTHTYIHAHMHMYVHTTMKAGNIPPF